MVKNTKGGSGHKSQARKFVSTGPSKKTRLAEDPDEIYGYVVSVLGGSMCKVHCQDNVERLCIIRGKFRGSKGKRDNFVSRGSWVLVGLRSFASESSKASILEKCDLLEVYSEADKTKLKTVNTVNWSKFILNDITYNGTNLTEDDGVDFSNIGEEEEYSASIISSSKDAIKLDIKEKTDLLEEEENNDDDDIDIDDI